MTAVLAMFAEVPPGLPDPKNYASLGWLLVCAGALLVLFNQGHAAWKNLRPRQERGGNVGRAELEAKLVELEGKITATKDDLRHQITEARTYAHGKVHDLQNEFSGFRGLHEARSEGVQNRINALMELVHHMRGQFDLVLAEQRASTAATQRAAVATEHAVRMLAEGQTTAGVPDPR